MFLVTRSMLDVFMYLTLSVFSPKVVCFTETCLSFFLVKNLSHDVGSSRTWIPTFVFLGLPYSFLLGDQF